MITAHPVAATPHSFGIKVVWSALSFVRQLAQCVWQIVDYPYGDFGLAIILLWDCNRDEQSERARMGILRS